MHAGAIGLNGKSPLKIDTQHNCPFVVSLLIYEAQIDIVLWLIFVDTGDKTDWRKSACIGSHPTRRLMTIRNRNTQRLNGRHSCVVRNGPISVFDQRTAGRRPFLPARFFGISYLQGRVTYARKRTDSHNPGVLQLKSFFVISCLLVIELGHFGKNS